jgi:hypothetical protein
VEVLFDGKYKMYLHTSWKKFARVHDVEVGCMVYFYEGNNEMSVKMFDNESCRIHYYNDGNDDVSEEDEGYHNL